MFTKSKNATRPHSVALFLSTPAGTNRQSARTKVCGQAQTEKLVLNK